MNLNATIIGQTIAFVIFVLFCMKYVWPPLISIIEKRQQEIADNIAFAERSKKDINIARIEASNIINQAKAKSQTIIDQANKYKMQLINDAKIAAKLEYDKILNLAKEEINNEIEQIREELRKHISTLVIASTEKLIKHSIDKTINNKIINKIIDEL